MLTGGWHAVPRTLSSENSVLDGVVKGGSVSPRGKFMSCNPTFLPGSPDAASSGIQLFRPWILGENSPFTPREAVPGSYAVPATILLCASPLPLQVTSSHDSPMTHFMILPMTHSTTRSMTRPCLTLDPPPPRS